ncbi:MAG: GNAT family N-acetyltransferase [Treponema sp.]|nr:GNAT family N-acetyltransferase [Candidatus Treponema equi]
MTFKLTDILRDQILFSMEDQGNSYLVSAAEGKVVVVQDDEPVLDGINYYSLPSWESGDGFEMMENFTAGLHNPNCYKELRRCLANRRGVFRTFKDILRSYPEVEQMWFAFKDKTMNGCITEWYNELCESWGLEQLEEDEYSEDTEYLVQDDFEFTEYDSVKDKECVDREVINMTEEYKEKYSGELGDAVADILKRQSNSCDAESKIGYVCYSHDHDFLGCALVSSCPSSAKKTVVFTDFFVIQNYRGLGIGRELLKKCLADLKMRGIQWLILTNSIQPESMESLLFEFSFKKTDFGYVKNFLE